MKFSDWPRYVPLSTYQSSTDRVVESLSHCPDVISVYQVGSVGTPGISDVDLWVIFEDGACFNSDPRLELNRDGRYLFTHHLFGICKSHFEESLVFQFFHDFQLLSGKDVIRDSVGGAKPHTGNADAERQAALEYVVKAHLGITVESSFGVIKVRNFLLHSKALMLDIDPLGFDDFAPELRDVLSQILELRDRWFSMSVNEIEILTRFESLQKVLGQGLESYFRQFSFFLPAQAESSLGVNLKISNGERYGVDVRGIGLPPFVLAMHRRLFNLQRRFMNFDVRLPLCSESPDNALSDRFDFVRKTVMYNRENLPHFVPVPYGLPIFG